MRIAIVLRMFEIRMIQEGYSELDPRENLYKQLRRFFYAGISYFVDIGHAIKLSKAIEDNVCVLHKCEDIIIRRYAENCSPIVKEFTDFLKYSNFEIRVEGREEYLLFLRWYALGIESYIQMLRVSVDGCPMSRFFLIGNIITECKYFFDFQKKKE
jgi:hypothetical protein